MKKITQNMDDTLLDYLDGKLSNEEKLRVEDLLASEFDLRKRLAELKETESGLRHLFLEQPAKNFTASVLSRLDNYPTRTALSLKNSILLLTGIVLSIGTGAWLLSAGVFDQMQTTFQLNELPLAQQYMLETLPSITINSKVLINIVLLVNLVLAFLLLDRAILKPFFQRRIETGH